MERCLVNTSQKTIKKQERKKYLQVLLCETNACSRGNREGSFLAPFNAGREIHV